MCFLEGDRGFDLVEQGMLVEPTVSRKLCQLPPKVRLASGNTSSRSVGNQTLMDALRADTACLTGTEID